MPKSLMYPTTCVSSSSPSWKISSSIFNSLSCSKISSTDPLIFINSRIFSPESLPIPFSPSSSRTLSSPILSNLSTVLSAFMESSMPSDEKKPFKIFLLLRWIVKSVKPKSLKVWKITTGNSASFTRESSPMPIVSISHW